MSIDNRSNFRVKLDLWKFYHDVRRLCCIFIDRSQMFYISDVKEYITKRFNIKEPFHLLLNDTAYLPPSEDIRILKENETILVLPGSGLKDDAGLIVNDTIIPQNQNKVSRSENNRNFIHHKEVQTISSLITKAESIISDRQYSSNTNHAPSEVSAVDTTFDSIIEDNETDSINGSKVAESNTTENCSILEKVPTAKRKRVRRKKPKKQMPTVAENNSNEEVISKKPKIIDSFIISSAKHIRFGNDAGADAATPMKPQLKDVIMFKMLKIAADYTPQVSEFIVGEVISYCPKTSMYTLKILEGISEIQVPIGKFTIAQDDATSVVEDTITLSYAQMIEPKLVSASDSNKTPVHVNT